MKSATLHRAGVLAGLLAGPFFLISVGLNTWASLGYLDQLGWEFVGLSCEARGGGAARQQALEAFEQCRQELKKHGLTLNDTVRSRLWARDRASRDAGSDVRAEVLSGPARASVR